MLTAKDKIEIVENVRSKIEELAYRIDKASLIRECETWEGSEEPKELFNFFRDINDFCECWLRDLRWIVKESA